MEVSEIVFDQLRNYALTLYVYNFLVLLSKSTFIASPVRHVFGSCDSKLCIPGHCQVNQNHGNLFVFSFEFCGHLFLSRCCSPRLPLLLSLSSTMATAKDFPGPTTGKYPSRWSFQARFRVCDLDLALGQDTSRPHPAWAKSSPCMDARSVVFSPAMSQAA